MILFRLPRDEYFGTNGEKFLRRKGQTQNTILQHLALMAKYLNT
jgi:hypothetical protein